MLCIIKKAHSIHRLVHLQPGSCLVFSRHLMRDVCSWCLLHSVCSIIEIHFYHGLFNLALYICTAIVWNKLVPAREISCLSHTVLTNPKHASSYLQKYKSICDVYHDQVAAFGLEYCIPLVPAFVVNYRGPKISASSCQQLPDIAELK